MRKTDLAIVAVLSVWCVPSMPAQAPKPPVEDGILSEHLQQDLSGLQLEPTRRSELEDALKLHDYRRAETILVEESERDPKSLRSARLLTLVGGIFFLDGLYLDSVIAWKRAEAIQPIDDRSRFTLAMAYIRLNRRDWARAELEKLAAAQFQNPLYLYWLARLDYDTQNYTAAIARLQKVIELDPKMVRAYDSLGLCYDYLGQPDEAVNNYKRAIELNRLQLKPSPWPHVDLAMTLIALNQLGEAERNLNEALRYDARLPQAHYQLARILEMRGDYQAAAEAVRLAAELNPAYPEPHLLLGRIYHRLGRDQQAKTEVERFQQLKEAVQAPPTQGISLSK